MKKARKYFGALPCVMSKNEIFFSKRQHSDHHYYLIILGHVSHTDIPFSDINWGPVA